MSVLPPGGKGTTKVRGLALWESAVPDMASVAKASTRYLENRLLVIFTGKPLEMGKKMLIDNEVYRICLALLKDCANKMSAFRNALSL